MDIEQNKMDWDDFLALARADLDWSKLDDIAANLPTDKHPTYANYLKTERWFRKLWDMEVTRLNLNRLPPQRILDLGTGPAFFPYICRCLGHEVLGLERPGSKLEAFHDWLRVGVVSYAIGAKKPLPRLPLRFDIVTSFRVPFNTKRQTGKKNQHELFNLEEWAFLLDEVRDHLLRPGGRFVLKMNSQPKHVGLHYGDPVLMEFFASRGAIAGDPDKYVTFDPLT